MGDSRLEFLYEETKQIIESSTHENLMNNWYHFWQDV